MTFARSPGALAPGATLGILGGGQLGRMLALAAAGLGLRSHVFAPEGDSPAFDVCAARTHAAYEDVDALAAFGSSVDVVTYEFENVPARTAALLSDLSLVRPGPAALAACQDRLVEKEFLAGIGVSAAAYMRVDDANTRTGALDALRAMPEAARLHLPGLLVDADADVRLLACDLVRDAGGADGPRWLCAMIETEPQANVCAAAVDVLGEIADAAAGPSLSRCAERFPDDPFLRFAIKVVADRVRTGMPAPRG